MIEVNTEPFPLGFEGEYWYRQLSALVVPVRDSHHIVMVTRRGNTYEVYGMDGIQETDSALMAAALVQVKIASYLGGNNVIEEEG